MQALPFSEIRVMNLLCDKLVEGTSDSTKTSSKESPEHVALL